MDAPTVTHSPTLINTWSRQSVWSRAADRLKRRIARSRSLALLLTVVGAVLATASSQLAAVDSGWSRALAFVAACAIAVVPVARLGSTRQVVEHWTRARSVSEALKADVYRYLAGTSPFRGSGRDETLASRSADYEQAARDISFHAEGIAARQRAVPPVVDVATYMDLRVSRQIDAYYRPNARQLLRRLARLRMVETTLILFAALLAASATTFAVQQLTAWTGVATTVAAAFAAHIAAGRYELQYVEFSRTADILERLRTGFATRSRRRQSTSTDPTDPDSDRQDDSLVDSAEHVISIQNEAWMAQMPTGHSD
jgi:hypothetical protein